MRFRKKVTQKRRGICEGGTEVILVMIWTIMEEEKLKG
jgi:hypothetical protein